jgi:hypothetical protein
VSKTTLKEHVSRRVWIDAIADSPNYPYNDAKTFKREEDCRTEFRVHLQDAHGGKPDWYAAETKIRQLPHYDDGEVRAVEHDGVRYSCRLLMVDFEALADPTAVEPKLLAPIGAWLASH